ncbi:MAG: PAS domain S-box protein [bacterium]|nr:PAS domain S-box protein [bacterium]
MSSELPSPEIQSDEQVLDVETLRRQVEDYERSFKSLDGQLRLLELERKKLAAIVNNTDAGFLMFDADGTLAWSNTRYRERFAGQSALNAGVYGLECRQVLCGKMKPCPGCPTRQAFERGASSSEELTVILSDRVGHIYATAVPIHGESGGVEQCVVMIQDVSDLEVVGHFQEAFRSSEKKFRNTFEQVAAGMVTAKADDTLLQVNPAFCTMLGYTESEMLRKKVSDVCHADDVDQAREQLHEIMQGKRRVTDLEARYMRRDGTIAWGHTTTVWNFDDDGTPKYSISLIQDITHRKHAEQELRESQQRFEELVNSVEGVVWEADPDTLRFSFVSRKAEAILGYPPQEWLAQPRFWRNRVHAQDLHEVMTELQQALDGDRGSLELEYRMVRADGEAVWLRDSIGIVRAGTRAVKLRGVMVDVTTRKHAEEALRKSEEQLRQSQKMEAIGRLAGGIAHDFNNLLTAITGYSEFLIRGLGNDHPQFREAAEIAKAADHAADLTKQLLAFSRQQVLEPKLIDLNDVVEDLHSMLNRVIGETVELNTTLDAEACMVKADPGQLRQVLLNLAVNARDAMGGDGELTILTEIVDLQEDYAEEHPDVQRGTFVMLAVTDNGCGMNDETLARLFDPFFTTKQPGEGTGLGLSTVYGIVKQSGGHIYVYSEPGRGTTFKVYLPQIEGDGHEAETEPRSMTQLSRGSETILLVEDDPSVRELTQEILQMNGYRVIAASDGAEALTICENLAEQVHLIVTDLIMPNLGGRELAERVGPILPETKILFLSGYTDCTVMQQGMLQPGSSFLQKPFSPTGLAIKVREVLENA